MDTLVIDIETKNTFGDVGGKEFLDKLEVSVVGVYSYATASYRCFEEHEFEELKRLLGTPALLIGFSANKFDFPILNKTLGLNLLEYPRIDISDEIEQATGRLIGLGALAELNLGASKSGQGLMAPVLYREGKIEELKEYCLQDVKITRDLFEKIKNQGYVLIPPPRDTGALPTEPTKPLRIQMQFDTSAAW